MLKSIISKNVMALKYTFFGVLTVIINTLTYLVFISFMKPLYSNFIAFIIAVFFAYVTNTLYVFSASINWSSLIKFFGVRIGTLALDSIVLLSLLGIGAPDLVSKIASNVIVVILNYILSKCYVYS